MTTTTAHDVCATNQRGVGRGLIVEWWEWSPDTGVAFDSLHRFVGTLPLEFSSPCVYENSAIDEIVHGSFSQSSVITTKTKYRKREAFEEVTLEMHPFTSA